MSHKKKISVRFIAEESGVSTATVSRVLNHDKNVSETTRKKVLRILEKYEYEAPAAPPSKVTKIGVLVPTGQSDYYMTLLREIGFYYRQRNIHVIACNYEEQKDYIPSALETLYDSNISGLILIACDYQSIKEHLLAKIPHVWIDCNDAPTDSSNICQVQSDHYVAGKIAAQELIRKNCVRPIIMTNATLSHRSFDRINGFRSVFEENHIPFADSQIIYMPRIKNFFAESQETIRYMVTRGDQFDSIFAINDIRSLGALVGLQQMNLKVPDDIKLIGFDGISIACNSILNITCIQQNIELLTINACDMLSKLMNQEAVLEKRILVPTTLLGGQTI